MNGKKEFVMKNVYLNIIVLAGILTGAASCTREEMAPTGENGIPAAGRTIILGASHEDIVKTTLDVSDGSVLWHDGDALKLLVNGADYTSAALVLTEDVASARFEFEGVTGDPAYAVYPASVAAAYDGSELKVTVPSQQDGTFANAAIEVAPVDAVHSAALQNLGGLLQLVIDNDAVRKVVVTSNASENLAGQATVSFDAEGIPQITAVAAGQSSVTANVSGAGTWYVATLPVTMTEGLCVQLFDESDQPLGEKISYNSLSVQRRQVCRLGSFNNALSGRFFIKANGTGSGSSWDDAASIDQLVSGGNGKYIFLAAGTHTISAAISIGEDVSFTLFGGYPSDATGTSLTGRDIVNNESVIDGDGKRILVFSSEGTSVTAIDGVTFQNAASSSQGSALILQNVKKATFSRCTLKNNTSTSNSNAGIVRAVTGAIVFKECTFTGNTTSGLGGVISMTSANGNLTLTDCVFSGNSAGKQGGAVYMSNGNLNVNHCTFSGNTVTATADPSYGGALAVAGGSVSISGNTTFTSNVALRGGAVNILVGSSSTANVSLEDVSFTSNRASAGGQGGGAICVNYSSSTPGAVTLDAKRCQFTSNVAYPSAISTSSELTTTKGAGGALAVQANATVRLDACEFTGNLAGTNGAAIRLNGAGSQLYMNRCCVYSNAARQYGGALSAETASFVAMNNCSFYQNAVVASTGAAMLYLNTASMLMVNTSVMNSSSKVFCLSGATASEQASIVANSLIVNKSTSKAAIELDALPVTSYGHNIYSLMTDANSKWTSEDAMNHPDLQNTPSKTAWDGDDKVVTYTMPAALVKSSPARIVSAINAFDTACGTDFYSWLTTVVEKVAGHDPLEIDARGVVRSTETRWPGAYEAN